MNFGMTLEESEPLSANRYSLLLKSDADVEVCQELSHTLIVKYENLHPLEAISCPELAFPVTLYDGL